MHWEDPRVEGMAIPEREQHGKGRGKSLLEFFQVPPLPPSPPLPAPPPLVPSRHVRPPSPPPPSPSPSLCPRSTSFCFGSLSSRSPLHLACLSESHLPTPRRRHLETSTRAVPVGEGNPTESSPPFSARCDLNWPAHLLTSTSALFPFSVSFRLVHRFRRSTLR